MASLVLLFLCPVAARPLLQSLLRALLWMTACFCGGSVVVWLYV